MRFSVMKVMDTLAILFFFLIVSVFNAISLLLSNVFTAFTSFDKLCFHFILFKGFELNI